VTAIGEAAFSSCKSLQDISFSEENENYASVDGALYNKDLSVLICYPAGKSGEFIVPSTVTAIGTNAFGGCASLSSIELPDSLISIGNYAFEYCTSLASIELPASLTEINYRAFAGCTSLASIEIPSSVTAIGAGAFVGCTTLESIELPASLTTIGYAAFYCCESLKTVTSLNSEPPLLGSDVFEGCPLETVYVPNVAVMDYKAADGWNEFNIVGIDVTGISDIVANGCDNGSVDCYTLQGVRVKAVRTAEDVKSLRPGIYIVNGKKVVVR
jgi:hypothetical protein